MYLYDSSKLNLDEVVFEHRNKAYGAYAIRKSYPYHLSRGVLITLMPLLLITIAAPLHHYFTGKSDTPVSVPVLQPPRIPVKEILELASGFTFLLENSDAGFEIVPDRKAPLPQMAKKPVPAIVQALHPVTGVNTGTAAGSGLPGSLPGIGLPGGTGGVLSQGSLIHDFVEQMPEYPGGMDALYAYLNGSLAYPRRALDNQVQGKVLVSFVVMPDGSVQQARVERGIGYGCDEEALRVVEQMPAWNAGIQNGNAVAVKMLLPLLFQTN